MNAIIKAVAISLVLLPPAGCKFVKTPAQGEASREASADPDDILIAALVDKTYESRLLPHISQNAVDAATLLTAIRSDLAATGARYGNKGAGEGAPWAFAMLGRGVVTKEDRKSRASKAEIDINGDGATDLTLQLGPVVKGTALRDVAPFYVFTEFRDQIQFAKLSRALNDRTIAALAVPKGSLLGKTLFFTGVFSVPSATTPVLVTPVRIEVVP